MNHPVYVFGIEINSISLNCFNYPIKPINYPIIFQMCKILSIDTDAESEFRAPSNPDDLTGLEAFAFGYEVQWPVSLVLNREVECNLKMKLDL